ncbi:MAG: helix-turn-helix domain-containing protein [Bacteroidales bacterium]|nr:helix-turn-helix domain-containing protein [Bacteroidales bacterium]
MLIVAICLKGTLHGSIDMQKFSVEGATLIVAFPGQILQHESFSDDFSGLFIVMSRQFIRDLRINVREVLSLNLSLRRKPWIPLESRMIQAMVYYYQIMKEVIQMVDNPYRIETAKHLSTAFCYGAAYYFHPLSDKGPKSKQEFLVEQFLNLVEVCHREEREVNFYANKLNITPKHLAKIVREISHKSANEWINGYVILEAQALLKYTNKTIQQISDELNFPSQSFFGKYFKRLTGLSPREYRRG